MRFLLISLVESEKNLEKCRNELPFRNESEPADGRIGLFLLKFEEIKTRSLFKDDLSEIILDLPMIKEALQFCMNSREEKIKRWNICYIKKLPVMPSICCLQLPLLTYFILFVIPEIFNVHSNVLLLSIKYSLTIVMCYDDFVYYTFWNISKIIFAQSFRKAEHQTIIVVMQSLI